MTQNFLENCLQSVFENVENDVDKFYLYESSIQFLLAKEIANRDPNMKITLEQDLKKQSAIDNKIKFVGKADLLIKEPEIITAIELKYYSSYRKMKESEAFHCLKDIIKTAGYVNGEKVYQKKTKNLITASFCIIIIEDKGYGSMPQLYQEIFSNGNNVIIQNRTFEFGTKNKPPQTIQMNDPLQLSWQTNQTHSFRYCILHNARK